MHESLVPPESTDGYTDEEIQEWKTEFDVVSTLRELKHQVLPIGLYDDLGLIRRSLADFKPHITFNLLEEGPTQIQIFNGAGRLIYDNSMNIVLF